jgi:arginine decarboxylase
MASLDAGRRQLEIHGESLLARTLRGVATLREQIATIPGCAVVGEDMVGTPGVVAWDPLRVVIDVRGTGCTGYELAAALRASYDTHIELATHATLVLVIGIAQPLADLERFGHDFGQIVRRVERAGETAPLVRPLSALRHEVVVAPRDAFLGEAEVVAVEDALGRVSAETIAGYPPGIPALLPGERISAEVIAYLRELTAAGARLHGASDPQFATINVLRA